MRRFIPVVMAVALSLGCHRPADKGPPKASETAVASQADLDALIAKRGSVTFRSWDGKWQGTDNDTDLTFLPNGVAHMLEYGDGISSYAGTYAVDPDGTVTATFAKFKRGWPPMSLRKDAVSLLVFPKDEKVGFVMGGRGGATVIGGRASFWPFRPIPEGEEAAQRERIKKRHRD